MTFQDHARLGDSDAFGFKELALKRSVRFTNEEFSALANDALPGNALPGRSSGHGVADGASASTKAQNPSNRPIS
jgi:hypothetical protein